MTATFADPGNALIKAGAKVNPAVSSASMIRYIEQAQATINAQCRYDFVANWASLKTNVKQILEECAENLAAMYAIQYDMSSYSSRIEAETMLDVLRDRFVNNMKILEDMKATDYLVN